MLKDPFAFRTSTEAGNTVSRGIINPQYNNWADRVGLVYRLTKNTVVRLGHGLYWNNVNNNQLTQSMSLYYPFVYNPQATESSFQLTPTMFNTNLYPARPTGTNLPYGPNFAFFTVQKTFQRPYTSQYNLNVQQTLGNNYLIEIGYMGNQSHHMPAYTNYNQARLPNPNIPAQSQPLQSRRPYPQYSSINMFDHMGNASYNGLTASLEKRYSSGFSYRAAYTWSKALDTGTDISSDPIKQPGDAHSYRSLAAIDTGHRFVGSYMYELPFGRGKKFLGGAGGVTNAVLGGWQVNGITTFSLGVPFGVTVDSTIPDVDAQGRIRQPLPAMARCREISVRGSATSIPRCFSIPAPGTFGNSARNLWHGPGVNNWDVSFFKQFPLWSEQTAAAVPERVLQLLQSHAIRQPDEFAAERHIRADPEREGEQSECSWDCAWLFEVIPTAATREPFARLRGPGRGPARGEIPRQRARGHFRTAAGQLPG